MVEFGVYRSPDEFHFEAAIKDFPMNVASFCKPWQLEAFTKMFTMSPSALCSHRARVMEWLVSLVERFKVEENELHDQMPDH
eukprot:2931976-Amphidinium_carterae.1